MISVPSPRLVEKVTHYLHQGFHDHSHSLLEPPPALNLQDEPVANTERYEHLRENHYVG